MNRLPFIHAKGGGSEGSAFGDRSAFARICPNETIAYAKWS